MSAPFGWLADWDQPLVTDRPLRVIGIDLGTTNSTITEIVWSPGADQAPIPSVIEVPQETTEGQFVGDIVPSVVAVLDEGRVLVGEGARRLRGSPRHQLIRNRGIFWETKNEIGTRRSYLNAPEGFRSPKEIATHVLGFLREAAEDNAPSPIDRAVITVPASFQWEQRQDTFAAAEDAGIDVAPGELLDEPVAAFLDYLVMHGPTRGMQARRASSVLIIDFGGGTCDVAALEVRPAAGGGLALTRLGVSRFHRIGGGDVDDIIAVDVLLPALVSQHGLNPNRLTYTSKRDYILPALSSVAASLKVKLSERIRDLVRLGTFDPQDRTLSVSLPASSRIPVKIGREVEIYDLATPTLTWPQLRDAFSGFLSAGWLAPRDTEYTHATSIFAPVHDVLVRCGLEEEAIDAVLLVGGSSLFPPVLDAVADHFADADILTYREPRDALRCVGRGAAYHALLLAAYGRSPLSPTTGETISIRTRDGLEPLVPRNSALPFPGGEGWAEVDTLRMPTGDGATDQPLTIQIVSGGDDEAGEGRQLAHKPIKVAAPVRAGDPITIRTRVDENQRLSFVAVVTTVVGDQEFPIELDNPFSVVSNPNRTRDRILELEERVAAGMGADERVRTFQTLAGLHAELAERERAREYYERILPHLAPKEQGDVLNRLGILCGQLHDTQAQKQYYREAARIGGSTVPLFNLAIALHGERKHPDALEIIDDVIRRDDEPAARALRGRILEALGRRDEAADDRRAAVQMLGPASGAFDYELGWVADAARRIGDEAAVKGIEDEQKRRAERKARPPVGTTQDSSSPGNLPVREA